MKVIHNDLEDHVWQFAREATEATAIVRGNDDWNSRIACSVFACPCGGVLYAEKWDANIYDVKPEEIT